VLSLEEAIVDYLLLYPLPYIYTLLLRSKARIIPTHMDAIQYNVISRPRLQMSLENRHFSFIDDECQADVQHFFRATT